MSRFDGHVVAKLPFQPFSLIQGLSHRNLMGSDVTDCSFIFLYILCTMSIREVRSNEYWLLTLMVLYCSQNVQKLLGFGLSRGASKVGGGFFSQPNSK